MAANDYSKYVSNADDGAAMYTANAERYKDQSTWFTAKTKEELRYERDKDIIDAAYRLYICGLVNIDGTYDYPYDDIIDNMMLQPEQRARDEETQATWIPVEGIEYCSTHGEVWYTGASRCEDRVAALWDRDTVCVANKLRYEAEVLS